MILAVDPGVSTGLAWVAYGIGKPIQTTVAPSRQLVYRAMMELKPKVVVIEWFFTGKKTNQYSRATMEICGGVEAVAEVLGARLVRQYPKDRERYLDEAEAMLTSRYGPRGTTRKGAGAWTDHQQDAAAHLLCYLTTLDKAQRGFWG